MHIKNCALAIAAILTAAFLPATRVEAGGSLSSAPAPVPTSYSVIPTEMIAPGAFYSYVHDMNDDDTAVGEAYFKVGLMFVSCAFVYNPDTGTEYLYGVPGLFGVETIVATAINDNGMAVGYVYHEAGLDAFQWNTTTGEAEILNTGPSNTFGLALGIDNNGVMVGAIGSTAKKAALWDEGFPETIGTLGGPISLANSINNGVVVGESYNTNGVISAFRWSGVMQALTPLSPNKPSYAVAVNSQGVAVGSAVGDVHPHAHAVMWKANGQIIDLGVLQGGTSSAAIDINDVGIVIGKSENDGGEEDSATLWWGKRMLDLNNVVEAGAPWLRSATAINNGGRIVCDTLNGAVILVPNTAPNTAASANVAVD
jgi:hypothetical protein